MNSVKESLMKNFESLNKEKVAVIHSDYRDGVAIKKKPTTVAFVEVDKTLSDEDKCEKAFMLTNSIKDGWWNNEGVEYIGPKPTCRSTSSGDQVLLSNGTKYNCAAVGWEKV